MKKIVILILNILLVLSLANSFASDQEPPVIDGEEVVAMVNDDPITKGEFMRVLSSIQSEMHTEKKEGMAKKLDYAEIMNRLITARLIRQEALTMGLDELPEVKEEVENYSRNTLIGLIRGKYVSGMKTDESDEEEVDKRYKEAFTEFKLKSLLVREEEEAGKIKEELDSGKDFEEIKKRVVQEEGAKAGGEGRYFKRNELLPQVSEAVSSMEIGSVSPVIKLEKGYAIFILEDVRVPESPEDKEQIREQVLESKKRKALEEYQSSLIKKYVKVNEEVLKGIDYGVSEEEFESLLKDPRVIAEIEGETPISVGELTEELAARYFHGPRTESKRKKLNDKKDTFLYENLLPKKVFYKEALAQGADKLPLYKSMVKEYESSVLFNNFLGKVIYPNIKVTAEDVEKYYGEHSDEYVIPELLSIKSIAFKEMADAEHAMENLNKGSDFAWVSANSEGQVPKDTEDLLSFRDVQTTKKLDVDIQKALSGVKRGDVRLYSSPAGYHYVLYIQDISPARAIPLEEVKNELYGKLFKERLTKSVDELADKLREVYDVKIYKTEL